VEENYIMRELNDLYFSPNILRVIKSRRMRWAGYSAYGEKKGVYRALVGQPEGKKLLESTRRRWEANSKVDR